VGSHIVSVLAAKPVTSDSYNSTTKMATAQHTEKLTTCAQAQGIYGAGCGTMDTHPISKYFAEIVMAQNLLTPNARCTDNLIKVLAF
jgi:hypothetical protein